jgi:undecaprenyl-phosphate 4-deoxy-4-formamido-L-arabinose transferase
MDDDGQTSANEIFKLVDQLEEGYDVVYADYPQKMEQTYRRMGSWLNMKMNEIMLDKPKGIIPNSYFIMRAFVAHEILKYKNGYPYVDGLIFRTTRNIGKVEIVHKEREQGKSGYTFKKLVSLWVNGFTSFSIKPLRISTLVGAICSIVGFIYGLIIVLVRLFDVTPISGWSSLMAAILFIGGMNMLMLGMVGEYLGRAYLCINNNPQYVVREVRNMDLTA